MDEAVRRLRFTGRLVPASFAAFARARAARLGLALEALRVGEGEATATLRGPAALLDAFELACALGPLDCLVRDCVREG